MTNSAPQPPPAAPLDSVLLYREVDRLDRRIDGTETRLARLDEHGSRGLAGLQVQLTELAKDVTALDNTFSGFRADLKASRRWLVGAYIGGLLPIYVGVVAQLLQK